MSDIPHIFAAKHCLGTQWFDVSGLLEMTAHELASRAFWEGKEIRAFMSPLMWYLEGMSYGQQLSPSREEACSMTNYRYPSGCFLFIPLPDMAEPLRELYANLLWEFAFTEATKDKLAMLKGLTYERLRTAHMINPNSAITTRLQELNKTLGNLKRSTARLH